MGDSINVLMDDLLALITRLLLFPVAFQVILYCSVITGLLLSSFYLLGWLKRPLNPELKKQLLFISIILCVNITAIVVLDYKNHLRELYLLQNNIDRSRTSVSEFSEHNKGMLQGFADSINHNNPDRTTQSDIIGRELGLEIYRFRQLDPLVVYYLAVVDLKHYRVILDSLVYEKELISTYAKRFDVDIAVNGEAGSSPGNNAPLGQWHGCYIVNGKVIYNTDGPNRPFIFFDNNNNAFYSKESEVVNNFSSNVKNAIWGRFDLLLNGQIQMSGKDGTQDNPYPRTIVGMNQDGSKIYLLVVDGRNPFHSKGFTMRDCGKILSQAGCYNAMACDQGGSSAMYYKKLGIFTKPADGIERVVYTHLGFQKSIIKY